MPLLSSQNYITVTQNQSIQDDETLVSAEGTFEAGFFSLGNSQRQYFGIWYKSISPRTIVWVANRDAPVQNSTATIKLTDKGNLLILDGSKGIIWSSNGSRAAEKPYMQLLDSGNLVVKDGGKRKKNLIWESFDYPGDTLLAGMKIKSNLVKGPTSYLTSWRNTEDPASGEFSYLIDTRGFPQLVITRNATAYYRAGPWTGKLFSGSSWLRLRKILTFSMQFTSQEISLEYETANRSIITRAVINPSGTTQRLLWSDRSQSWEIISTHPTDQCTYYGLCGANSMCDISNNPICHCLEGFRPKFQAKWNSFDWPGGCVPMKNLSCQNGDGFLKHTGVKLPDTSSSWYGKNKSLDECGTLCLQNCSCTSYAYLDNDIGGSACLIWFGDILDLSIHPNPDQGQEIYIKVVASELDHRRNKKSFMTKKLAGSLAGIVALVICIIILGLATSTCIQRKKNERGDGDSTRSKLLDWNKRLQIIDGIARGLLYLHQDSRLRIIHRDLKTSNILLDNEMNPKISDFGLARIFIGDQVEARTKRVMGTGYMPPEYAVHGSFSIKSDVFSFGVIVLEIISGKKIRKFYDPHHHLNLLSHAWRLWIEGSPLELVDKLFEDSIIPTEILRYIHVALLCVQRRPETRPDMLSIVLMLNGEKELPKPSLPAFYTGKHDPILLESPSRRCSTSVTISLEAR
uniref:non-specific serine/threonine protein kinase n=1 Tax=Lotus japonicus TaxID=34305 RepID=B0BLA2_LOTJA|nr:CM0216.570.nc [Lotus japonicus]